MRRFVSLCLLLCCLCLATSAALAQQASAASEYEIALSQALDAHARGEYEAARLFMERAHALEPSARTLRGLGIVAFAQKRQLAAIRYLDEALASRVKPLPDDLRTAAEELLTHAWAQVARYEILIDPPEGDFLIDGQAPDLYAAHTVVLEPGPHVLTARARTRAPYELRFEAQAGTHETLRLILAVPPAPEVIERVAPESRRFLKPTTQLKPAFYTPTVRWSVLGAGAVLVGTGAALWGVGYKRLQDVDESCKNRNPSGCTHEQAQHAFDHRHIGALSISSGVLLGVGAAALVSVASIELWRLKQRRARVELSAGLGSAFVSGRF